MTRPRRGRPADLDDARALPEEVIIDDLRSLGVELDPAAFRQAATSALFAATRGFVMLFMDSQKFQNSRQLYIIAPALAR